MELREASRLRIYCEEDDVDVDVPLYQAILREAHLARLAGASVLRGVTGYGPASLAEKHFQFSADGRPMVIEIIDSAEKIAAFLPTVEKLVESGAVTVEPVRYAALRPR